MPKYTSPFLRRVACIGAVALVALSGSGVCHAQSQLQPPSFGINPAAPESVQAGIDAARAAGASRVIIPPGVYHLPRPAAAVQHLRFTDIENMEIEATGVTFVLTGRDRKAISFEYCDGVTLRGATFLRPVPPFSQGKITAIDTNRMFVDIRTDPGYPADLDDKRYFPSIPVFNVYEHNSQKLKALVPDIYIARVERLGADTFRFHARRRIDNRIPIEAGDPAAWRGGTTGGEVTITTSARMRMEDVTLINPINLGFFEFHGEGGNVYKNCTVTYGDIPAGGTDLPLISAAADGLHSNCMRLGPTIENCLFEGMNDDAINIHGTTAMVAATGESNRVVLDIRRSHTASREYIPFARPGDRLRLYGKNGALSGEGVVRSLQRLEGFVMNDTGWPRSPRFTNTSRADYWEIIFEAPLASEAGGTASNVDMIGSGFVIRDSVFRNNRARGILIRAGEGIIENNLIEFSTNGGIVLWPEVMMHAEPDYARNVLIRGNTLRETGLASRPWNSGITITGYFNEKYVPLPGGHRDIIIEDNIFEQVRGANIVITSAIGVEIRGNRFIEPMTGPAMRLESIGIQNDGAIIWARHADNVLLENNVVERPGPYFNTLVDTDATATLSGLPAGLILSTGN